MAYLTELDIKQPLLTIGVVAKNFLLQEWHKNLCFFNRKIQP